MNKDKFCFGSFVAAGFVTAIIAILCFGLFQLLTLWPIPSLIGILSIITIVAYRIIYCEIKDKY